MILFFIAMFVLGVSCLIADLIIWALEKIAN